APSELAPEEDIGFAFAVAESDPGTIIEYFNRFMAEVWKIDEGSDSILSNFQFNGFSFSAPGATNGGFAGFILAPWGDRDETTQAVPANTGRPGGANSWGLQEAALRPPAPPSPGTALPVEGVIASTAAPRLVKEVVAQV